MSGLSGFLAQNAVKVENEYHIISDRFLDGEGKPMPWEIRSIDEEFNESIRKSCITRERDKKTKQVVEKTNHPLYLTKLIVECVVFPNLKDAELQQSYGVLGAEALVKKMLEAGEYSRLLEKVMEVTGFDDDMEDKIEAVKN